MIMRPYWVDRDGKSVVDHDAAQQFGNQNSSWLKLSEPFVVELVKQYVRDHGVPEL